MTGEGVNPFGRIGMTQGAFSMVVEGGGSLGNGVDALRFVEALRLRLG